MEGDAPTATSPTTAEEKDGIEKHDEPAKVAPKIITTGFVGICKTAAKHFPVLMGIYLMGYFNVSIAWVIGLVGLTAAREQWRKERDYRMSAARASVLFDEKEVILARVADLPSWV